MGGKATIFCLLVILLCYISTGLLRRLRLNRKCTRRIFRILRRRCRNPVIPMRPTTMESKLLSPTTKVTTPRARPPLHSSGLPYCTPRDVNAVLQQSERQIKRSVSHLYLCMRKNVILNYDSTSSEFDICKSFLLSKKQLASVHLRDTLYGIEYIMSF